MALYGGGKRKLAAAVKRHHKRLRSQMLPAKLY
jgi:ribosomal protein S21